MFKNGQKRKEGGGGGGGGVTFVHLFPCQLIGGVTINHLYRRHISKINSLMPFS